MPRPAYPPDWASTVRGLQRGVRSAYTAAQTRVRYAAIRAASIIIGPQVGAQITIDPGDPDVPPHMRIVSEDGDGYLVGRGNSIGIGSGLTTVGADEFAGFSVGGGPEPAYANGIIAEDNALVARVRVRAHDAQLWATGDAEVRSGMSGGNTPYGVVRTYVDGAILACYAADGSALSSVWAQPDGTVSVYQSGAAAASSAEPTTFAATADTTSVTDPGADADTADQVAYLRGVVDAQAAELAAMRERLDAMPRFRRMSAEELGPHLHDRGDRGEQ